MPSPTGKCSHYPEIPKPSAIIGAVAGDVLGSVYEKHNIKTAIFDLFNPNCVFTDDTVLTLAVADSILNSKDFASTVRKYGIDYPGRGYGVRFQHWLQNDQMGPYMSFGNGSAMRVSAVGFAYPDIATVLDVARTSAMITHDHPEGIRGAQATAAAVFLAKNGESKSQIREYIRSTFDYPLDFRLDDIRPSYRYDISCKGTVPQAITAFLESANFVHSIRLAISIGGDSDTIACITGGIAAAFYKEIPSEVTEFVINKLPAKFVRLINKFDKKYGG